MGASPLAGPGLRCPPEHELLSPGPSVFTFGASWCVVLPVLIPWEAAHSACTEGQVCGPRNVLSWSMLLFCDGNLGHLDVRVLEQAGAWAAGPLPTWRPP